MQREYARINNNIVAELFITEGDIMDIFHPSIRWIDVTGKSVAVGMSASQSGDVWLFNSASTTTLEELKDDKRKEMKDSCHAAIISGIDHNALGAMHHYPTNESDQINLNGLITESMLLDAPDEYMFWCENLNGEWARKPHSTMQIKLVGKAVAAHIKSQQQKYETKLAAIDAAATPEMLSSVVWQ